MRMRINASNRGSSILEIVLFVIVVVVVGFVGWEVRNHYKTNSSLTTTSQTPPATSNSTTASSGSSGKVNTLAPSSDTSDQNLNAGLTSINSGLNQGSQDSASANTALNDQSQQITVPTY